MSTIIRASNFLPDPAFPLRLFPVEAQEAGPGFHSHEFAEIVIILSGTGTYETAFSRRRLAAGDVMMIPEGEAHGYSQTESLSLVNLLFQPRQLPLPYIGILRDSGFAALFTLEAGYCRKMRFLPYFPLPEADFRRVRGLLTHMLAEQTGQPSGWQFTVLGGFLQLLALLGRHYRPGPGREARSPGKIADVVHLLNTHFREDITLAALARRAGMSANTLLRHFKQATGRTPVNYRIAVRLAHAAQALGRGASIDQAAHAGGFDDTNYFSRLFRREYRIAPSRFLRCNPGSTEGFEAEVRPEVPL